MEENQKINCTVESCRFNDMNKQLCTLSQINVEPCLDCDTTEPDESMCASYEYKHDEPYE